MAWAGGDRLAATREMKNKLTDWVSFLIYVPLIIMKPQTISHAPLLFGYVPPKPRFMFLVPV